MKLEVIDAAAKEATDKYNCTDKTWGVFKAYAFFRTEIALLKAHRK